MDLKDKLNLVWKFLFLAVFTYGVCSLSCCANSCNKSACDAKTSCSASDNSKSCSKDAESSQCTISSEKACCQATDNAPKAKECGPDCTKPCCTSDVEDGKPADG